VTSTSDLLVVGGGPVGLAAAIEGRMLGLSVTVIEPRSHAIDKACGEGLMPGALPALARLGVDPVGFPLTGVSYRNGRTRVDHLFPGGEGRGVRRTVLHEALGSRARSLGVTFVPSRVDALEQDADGVTVAGLRGRYLLGADGLHSTVRTLVGLSSRQTGTRRFGLRRHFFMEPESDLIEVHWTPTVEAYVTPVGNGVVGVSLLGRRGTDFDSTIAAIPELARRVHGRAPASALRGAGSFRQVTSRRSSGRVLLIGDASGYVDAITGEGIRVGLAQARAAIECIARNDPAGYEGQWARATRDSRMLTGGLVSAASSPLRGAIVPLAATLPWLFGAVVDRLAR
jgi:flavin-dependent dehydrogenase